jgi:protein-disulfide isomerase
MVVVKERLIDTGKARLLFFDFPLKMHPHALLAARAARCAGEQGRFWDYHDALFSAQQEWSPLDDPSAAFEEMAARTVDDEESFSECLRSRRFRREVDQDVKLGRSLGVRATPTIFVNGTMLADAGSAEEIESLVLQALGAPQSTP